MGCDVLCPKQIDKSEMERLLHYVWKHRMLPLAGLTTTDGRPVEVLDPGTHNHDRGPDFFNAKVRLGGILWAGNVELHLRSSDWFRHHHDTDPAYDGTVLHVVQEADCEVTTSQGRRVPQTLLAVPEALARDYQSLLRTNDFPRCHQVLPSIDAMHVHAWMDRLLAERMRQRAALVQERVNRFGGDWERACFVTLCRNFGFGLNGDVFERWATTIPLQAAGKHRDHLMQVEALFLGMAGLLEQAFPPEAEADRQRMEQEFQFLAAKFSLTPALSHDSWRYLRTRPQNFPHVRVRQIARLYHSGQVRMDALLEVRSTDALHERMRAAGLSTPATRLIVINTVVPLLYAYGMSTGQEQCITQAEDLLSQLPAEDNRVLRLWRQCGIGVDSAADSQALLQLKTAYCDRLDCLRCQFGYAYLKASAHQSDAPVEAAQSITCKKGEG